MTDHLPECPQGKKWLADCCCRELRACEQRVVIEGQAWHRKRGYAAGLDAAEAAVKALIHSSMCDCESCWWKADALDAVRALKEKP